MTKGNPIEERQKRIRSMGLQKLLALGVLIILYVFFCIFGNGFFSKATAVNILDSTYYVAFMAFGITFVIISGGIDLSIGTNMMCSALIGGYLYKNGLPMWVCLIAVVLIATLFGFINGVLIARLKLPPFIATLGVMMMTQGLGSIITKVETQRYPNSSAADGWYKTLFFKTANGFPTGLIYMAIFFVIALFLLTIYLCDRFQRRGRPAIRRQCGQLENPDLHHLRRFLRSGGHRVCRILHKHHPRHRQRAGNESNCGGYHRRYVDGRRDRHHVRHVDRRAADECAQSGTHVHESAGAFPDLLHRPGRDSCGTAG